MHIKTYHKIVVNIANICTLFAIMIALNSCRHEHNELAHSHSHSHAESAGMGHHHAPTHIIIEPEQAEKFDIQTMKLEKSDFNDAIKVAGTLDVSATAYGVASARSSGIIRINKSLNVGAHVSQGQAIATISGSGMQGGDASELAAVNLANAKRELNRLTPLHEDGIVSTREYNEALRAYETAKAEAGSSNSKNGSVVLAPLSGKITAINVMEGQAVESGTPVATIVSDNSCILRANLPIKHATEYTSISDADFRMNGSSEFRSVGSLGGKKLPTAERVAENGYLPIYFLLPDVKDITPGTACEIYLKTSSNTPALSVPLSALSEQQGQTFVYVKIHYDAYEKRPVEIGRRSADAAEIVRGMSEGDSVVVNGLIFVRLAETSSVHPEGHSHNH